MLIGTATIKYDQNGAPIVADFVPSLNIHLAGGYLKDLASIPCGDQSAVKSNADLIFSKWINQVNNIELADPNQYSIDSKITACDKWEDDKVKTCTIEYHFNQRNPN